LSTKFDRTCARNSDFWATAIRDLGPALQLFRIESERLKLSAPFNRLIAESLDADAAGQATLYGCFDKIGSWFNATPLNTAPSISHAAARLRDRNK
jgi:hypothetical protein